MVVRVEPRLLVRLAATAPSRSCPSFLSRNSADDDELAGERGERRLLDGLCHCGNKCSGNNVLSCILLSRLNDYGGQIVHSHHEHTPLERTGTDRHRPVHGHPRRRDRQRRAPLDQARSRVLATRTCSGSSRPTRSSSAERCSSAAASPTCSDGGGCSSPGCSCFAASSLLCRLRLVGRLAHRLPRGAGPRRRAPRAGRALAPDDDVRRGPRAQPRARDLRRRVGQRRGCRRPARRPAHELPQLVVDLLRQRARSASPRRSSRRSCSARAAPTSATATSTCAARRPSTAGLMLLVYALTRATTRRLGRAGDDRPPRRLGRVARRCSSRFEARSPWPLLPLRLFRAADARRVERGDGDHRRGRVLGVLRPHAVPAGRPPLQPRREWRRVRRLRRDGRRSSRTSRS